MPGAGCDPAIRVNLGAVGSVEPGVTSSADPPFGLAATGASPTASASLRASVTGRRRGLVATPPASDRFEDRFEELATIAYRVTYRLLGSRTDAEDLTQETLTRAYQRWRKVRGHAEPWVARVAANLALDAIRRDKRRPTVAHAGGDERAAPEAASPVDRVELVRVLQDLPRRQREVVVLRYLADLPETEVARELGISVGSVKQHASRGLAALRSTAADPDAASPDPDHTADHTADRTADHTADHTAERPSPAPPATSDRHDKEDR